MKIAAYAPKIVLGDPRKNAGILGSAMEEAAEKGAEWLVFPRLSLCGCTCGSLLGQEVLREGCEAALTELLGVSERLPGLTTVVSLPRLTNRMRLQTRVLLLREGKVIREEKLHEDGVLDLDEIVLCLPDLPGVVNGRTRLCTMAEGLARPAVVVTPGAGESGTDGVYTGGTAIADISGCLGYVEGELLLCDTERDAFEPVYEKEWEGLRNPTDPFFPYGGEDTARRCERILALQSRGLADRMARSGCRQLVLGLSGGLDSTWALLVGAEALGLLGEERSALLAVTMPGFGTVSRTRSNAEIMASALGVRFREIPIGPAAELHLRDIGHDPENRNAAYENAQARERTQILMDLANDENALVLGTGDLSELALGWCTYNGDHMSMYGVNAALPKTGVRRCTRWYAETKAEGELKTALLDVLDTPVSPELLPGAGDEISQSTEAILGPYELHDFFLWHFLCHGTKPSELYRSACEAFEGRYESDVIETTLRTFLRRFFTQQFKRSCLPDGPVLWEGVSLSPRTAWHMPSDIGSAPWIAELDRTLGK